METIDAKTILRSTLTKKQELVRDYQTVANQITDAEIAKLYKHFAEAEALHATKIKAALNELH